MYSGRQGKGLNAEKLCLSSKATYGLWKSKHENVTELGKWWNHKPFLTNSCMPCYWILQDTAEKPHHVVSFKHMLDLLGWNPWSKGVQRGWDLDYCLVMKYSIPLSVARAQNLAAERGPTGAVGKQENNSLWSKHVGRTGILLNLPAPKATSGFF